MLKFTKMHGCGNDYVYVSHAVENPQRFSKFVSDRHKGIGADGLVLILPCENADAEMRMYNSDGSEGSMCGNAIRCVAKWLFDNEYVKNSNIQISTKSGIKTVVYDEKTSTAKVDMGKPTVLSKGFVNHIDVGNPHAVIFCNDVDGLDLDAIGPFFEKSSYFKNGVNTEFVQVIGRNHLKMRVWERGSGETMACGTGAVASATAAVLHDFCDEDKDIIVELGGGELVINITDDTAFLIGSATTVYTGDIEYEDK